MRELIRHILKENNIQQSLKKIIEDDNIFKAADLVGGMSNLKSIFKDDPELSSLFDKLTGTITFYYSFGYNDDIEFPLKYEIINRHSNVHNTNHWPDINVFYDENKLDPEENDTFKQMIKYLVDEAQHSGFISKFEDSRLFNVNYLTVKKLNGEDIDSIDEVISFDQDDIEYLHDKLYGESESLNESDNNEIDKNLRAINVLLSLVSWDGLCDIWVEYNPDDKEYDIRSKTVTSNDLGPSIFKIEEELESLNSSISSMGIRVYIYTPWYVDNCEDEVKFMNESVPAQVRRRNEYFDMFFKGKRKNINYCSFRHPDHLMNYLLERTLEDLYHAWFYETVTYEEWEESIPYIENYIKDRYYNETLELWINKCRGRRLYETENKEQSLQKLIYQYGLYDFIKMSGLDFNQVKSILNKMGNPKELLKQYIREFVLEKGGSNGENYGSIFAVQIPLSDTKYVEDILVHDEDSIAIEMWEYHLDEYGHREQKDQYLTTINNLTNDELLSIISWMMEVIEGGFWD